jgi:PTS system nitrogen regulatory IIA component
MQLSKIIDSNSILLNATSSSKDEMLKEIASIAVKSELIDNSREDELYNAFKDRESVGTTGFGGGIAIPHCRIDNLDKFVVGVVIHKSGVDFDSLDKKKTELFAFIIGPKEARNDHVHVLSKLSRVLSDKTIISELKSAESTEAALEAILRRSGDDLSENLSANEEQVLMHLVVQREDIFENLVEVFASIDNCSATIIRGDESSSYFGTVPLFKGFFADDESFNRVVVATLPKKLANETVRQIEQISGDISKKSGVLVTVQELFYINGSLNY